jgi:Domain of unknown function (DUF5916)
MIRKLLTLAICVSAANGALAQELQIPFSQTEPSIEDFLRPEVADAVSDRMTVVSDFTQRVPNDGMPASERTNVYLSYDRRNLYAVFVAFDDDPQALRAHLAPREQIDDDDRVGLLIDTFNDQRTAYGFRSNPVGVQWDARWSEITKGANYDTAFEAVWYTDARVTDFGYVIKMTIPFRTLRFAVADAQRWRIQFERLIPRRSEESYWPAYSITVDGRLNQAATMVGVSNVSPGRNVQLIPFAFVRSYDVLDQGLAGGPGFDKNTEDDLGLDAKMVFRDSMVLDFTYNPDFSQVESDEPQITVNQRFEVLFPERRPFFLENADYFTTESNLVFTRRIVDPKAGLRFTGRQGPWGVAAMLMDDEAPGQGLPASDPLSGQSADVTVVRAFRDFSEQSRFGMLYTERRFGDAYNKVASVDSRMRLTQNWSGEMQLVDTDTLMASGQTLKGNETDIRFDRNGRHALVHAHFLDQSTGFRADLGFLNRNYRPDTKGFHSRVQYRFYPEGSWIDRWGPNVNMVYHEDRSGQRIYEEWNPRFDLNWSGDSSLYIGYVGVHELLRPKDFAALTANREYPQQRWNASIATNTFAKFGFSATLESGTSINLVPPQGAEPELADSTDTQLSMLWRPSDRLRVDTTYLYTELSDRTGAGKIFDNRILRTRWNYQFTKELSLRVILQQEETNPTVLSSLERDKNRNLDILARYVLNPYSALYIGYNTNSSNFQLIDTGQGTQLVRTDSLDQDGKQLFVKFSYLLRP